MYVPTVRYKSRIVGSNLDLRLVRSSESMTEFTFEIQQEFSGERKYPKKNVRRYSMVCVKFPFRTNELHPKALH